MNFIDPILKEFTYEMANTRKVLERAPMEKHAWKPHDKSMSLGQLASHVAESPTWAKPIVDQDELSLDLSGYKPPYYPTGAELLAAFDAAVAGAKQAMQGRSNEMLMVPWRLKVGGQVIFELPRVAVIRSMVLNHIIHHRGQLTVYLRLLNVPLCALYGPTADERMPH